ncbi:DNA polymerase III subunit delta' [Buchnera aphidicola (Macrosiphoniella sanborni)]|uniref:DNA polymerase III subunit delta' n=1 Tax=Buchnera aphidicola (Macrosiphoniella sanborni) TaxID=1241865 RepID=A0A4D6Y2Y9_9GAMM|nr:DNA polymerase III subunit delta' C-terminal domain-containing protein [Buchnera aphidicola]QCI23886.1 DNA polymerase III subunit delta' [Buchnera aphidicola (Macrosiphoniella sanborni)]
MKLYPWLIKPYNNIIQQHKKKKNHHAILLKTQRGIGASLLIWFISRWLLCLQPKGIHFCNECHGCQLMSSNNHPDWYNCINHKKNYCNIDTIRIINEKIFQYSQQGGCKIIFLSDIEKITESAANAFLKTLEEPPKNTWFFLINYRDLNYFSTLNSRCLIYKLFLPSEKESLNWLKQETKQNNTLSLTALRINQGSPISAKKFINGNMWTERTCFFQSLDSAFKKHDLVKILPILQTNNTIIKIDWICLLLFDAIKLNFNQKNYLINFDQIKLIQFLSDHHTNIILDFSIRTWMHCKHRFLKISGINHELLLLEQLLKWEKILNNILKN